MAIASTISRPAESAHFHKGIKSGANSRNRKPLEAIPRGKVEVPALRGVQFQGTTRRIRDSDGPSGCGKSSLLYVIGGLAQSSRGGVLVDGNDWRP